MNIEPANNLDRRFAGIERLYGSIGTRRIRSAHVAVIGIGGVGSWAVEALARSAVGRLTLIDMDHVAESNINRQIHAVDSNLGKAKVIAMAERVDSINQQCRVDCIDDFVTLDNVQTLMQPAFDYVIDCTDGFRVKAAIIACCRRKKQRFITVGGAGGQVDPLRIKLADLSRTENDALLAKTRKLLRMDYGFPRNLQRRFDVPCVFSCEQPVFPGDDGEPTTRKPSGVRGLNCAGGLGSISTVTASFALVAVSHALRKIVHGA